MNLARIAFECIKIIVVAEKFFDVKHNLIKANACINEHIGTLLDVS